MLSILYRRFRNIMQNKQGIVYPLAIALFLSILILLLAYLFLLNSGRTFRVAQRNVQLALDSYAVQRSIDAASIMRGNDTDVYLYEQIKNQDNTSYHTNEETVENLIKLTDDMIDKDKFINILTNQFGYSRTGDVLSSTHKASAVFAPPYEITIDSMTTTGKPYEIKVTYTVKVIRTGSSLISTTRLAKGTCYATLNWKDEGEAGTKE